MRKKEKNIVNYLVFIIVGFVLFNLVWWVCARIFDLKALPNPLDVYSAYNQAISNDIADHTLASLWRVLKGIAVSLAIALPIGLLMGTNKAANRILSPFTYFTYPIPKLALLPIVMVIFGIGEVSKVIIIVLIIVFQLIISIRDAIAGISKGDYHVLISLKATKWQQMRHITLPAIMPEILSSLRISSGIAISALFFTETFGTDKGLGFYITDSWMRIDYLQMYFGIFVLSMLGFLLFLLLDVLETIVCKWKN
ncbi:ABC-type nitrate/sulfonate/bicarbonate transport system permease component [Dysgonomonas sp. PH5-45]|uniref:ABC transporter permease n=1 Tax=unclassified Dysgonomonas TaxID=2630389 RepID=UPI0024759D3D|nr:MULTISPECIES: ABC transporter permease [unclassified Dysgonomonas]MDH6354975.1 ABC-type nitrate/sulfonate/bicarbonate transport system permease component [Dysgonomonas sp. PH5-45]MDH6387901.1 ABC-type nitrate/sulfonate/bicarbonate transport system permease component [Dysgonomonas sp. PH5-37]